MSLKKMWSSIDTYTLISSVESRYDDFRDLHKRKTFWDEVCEDLASQNIHYSQAACKKKWRNLIRTYRAATDNKIKTGKDPAKFPYYSRLDTILGDSALNSYSFSSDLDYNKTNSFEQSTDLENNDVETVNFFNDNDYGSSSDESSPIEICKKRKISSPEPESVTFKKHYYERKEKLHRMFVQESLKIKKEKLEIERRRLELEERKVIALETLAEIRRAEGII